MKNNSNIQISEDDEQRYEELKKEIEVLYQDIATLESAHKQLIDLKNLLLVREIKTE